MRMKETFGIESMSLKCDVSLKCDGDAVIVGGLIL